MKTDACRHWKEDLGAYALGHLADEERAALEAHLEGCAACRAEADSLFAVSRLLPHADPERFGPAPQPPAELGKRIAATIGSERRSRRRQRRLRFGLGFGGAAAATAMAILAIFVLSSGSEGSPEQHVAFRSLPSGVKIAATLEPQAFGTEIHMYVNGISSGTLCRVYMRGPGGENVSAGTFRYRWGADDSAVLSAALDLSRAEALVVHAGKRTFVAPLSNTEAALRNQSQQEEST
ncbi:MAG TPA: zf-HC2 domain-containing protein [Solirubrobacterales bacterium]|nr:zf-HC2 domain-containing protein [Solirubrobacterales bacterium]